MTPQQKAKELVNKFKSNVYKKAFANSDFMYDRYYGLDDDMAKQCALIAVDKISKCTKYEKQKFENDRFSEDYWQEVKKEIEAL
jgi:hypothetical protein